MPSSSLPLVVPQPQHTSVSQARWAPSAYDAFLCLFFWLAPYYPRLSSSATSFTDHLIQGHPCLSQPSLFCFISCLSGMCVITWSILVREGAPWEQGPCLLLLPLYPQHPDQCLAPSKHSVNIWWVPAMCQALCWGFGGDPEVSASNSESLEYKYQNQKH